MMGANLLKLIGCFAELVAMVLIYGLAITAWLMVFALVVIFKLVNSPLSLWRWMRIKWLNAKS